MNKKILGIIAGSVAALGSAIVAAPAHAQTATLPVTLEVQPSISLSTYGSLNFVITQKDLTGTVPDQSVIYDEKGTITPPRMQRPTSTTAPGPITRTIDPFYYVWASTGTTVNVNVAATDATLNRTGSTDPDDVVTMSVINATPSVVGAGSSNSAAQPGSVRLGFAFSNGTTSLAAGKYEGGQLAITVSTP